jgi:hypothetical protein
VASNTGAAKIVFMVVLFKWNGSQAASASSSGRSARMRLSVK